jgi:hypothetical protein
MSYRYAEAMSKEWRGNTNTKRDVDITYKMWLSRMSVVFISEQRYFFCHLSWSPFLFRREAWGLGVKYSMRKRDIVFIKMNLHL